eukprot:gene25349-11131_t
MSRVVANGHGVAPLAAGSPSWPLVARYWTWPRNAAATGHLFSRLSRGNERIGIEKISKIYKMV